MGAEGGEPGPAANMAKALAFYLPQFHPIPENDRWWGPGFTEWRNVMRARPLFPGHYQPHVPGELGYYDLRVPEVRAAQAELARSHGISGFVYYHYWFCGRRLLERPFAEVLSSGEPDFPFALCWANEEWTRNWDAQSGRVLVAQEYSPADDLAHIRWLLGAFADDRYIKIDGRPLMLVYRADQLPEPTRTFDTWRTEAQRAGFPDLYLCWVESRSRPAGGPGKYGMDATVGFMPRRRDRELFVPAPGARSHHLIGYEESARDELARMRTTWKRFPAVMTQWDNTPRRPYGATIFWNAHPPAYENWLRQTVAAVAEVRPEENYVFLVAWNEWAEGNHLEPDERYGRAFLEATRRVMAASPEELLASTGSQRTDSVDGTRMSVAGVAASRDESLRNLVAVLRRLVGDPERTVVALGRHTDAVAMALRDGGFRPRSIEVEPGAVRWRDVMGRSEEGLGETDALGAELDALEPVGAVVVSGLLEGLVDPESALSSLSAWSLKHGEAPVVVVVPNASHFDVALGLLCDRGGGNGGGAPGAAGLRPLTGRTLRRLAEGCGWKVVDREDVEAVASDRYDHELDTELPPEMLGALHVLATAYNPSATTREFVWALRPVPVEQPPRSFEAAVAVPDRPEEREPNHGDDEASLRADPAAAVRDYLDSVGLLTMDLRRRLEPEARRSRRRRVPEFARSKDLPRWKRASLAVVYAVPGMKRVFARVYRQPD